MQKLVHTSYIKMFSTDDNTFIGQWSAKSWDLSMRESHGKMMMPWPTHK